MTALLTLTSLAKKVPLRWWLYLAGAALLAYLIWHDHHQTQRANRLARENVELEERASTAEANAAKAREASDAYQKRLAANRGARGATPVRSVRLCLGPERVPATAGGHDAAGSDGLPEAPGRDLEAGPDIGPDLYALADEADECAIQRDALIDWVLSNSSQ